MLRTTAILLCLAAPAAATTITLGRDCKTPDPCASSVFTEDTSAGADESGTWPYLTPTTGITTDTSTVIPTTPVGCTAKPEPNYFNPTQTKRGYENVK